MAEGDYTVDLTITGKNRTLGHRTVIREKRAGNKTSFLMDLRNNVMESLAHLEKNISNIDNVEGIEAFFKSWPT